MTALNLPFAASATRRPPTADELANGYGCGDADKQLFDWMGWWPTGQIAQALRASGQGPDDTILTQLAQAISTGINLGTAGGTNNALTATIPSITFPSLQAGMQFTIKFANANSGPATLDLTGFTSDPPAIAIVRNDNGAALEGGELIGWGKILFDGTSFRLMNIPRLRTSRVTVGAGGVTVAAANEYTTYVMDLAVRQIFTLPAAATMPIGFRVTMETTGSPSGFQTSYVNVTGGGNLFYRGSGSATFYLIGTGEVFEFVNTGTQWLVRLVSQPAGAGVFRSAVSQPATVAVNSAFGDVFTDTVSGSFVGATSLFQMTTSTIRVPVSGVYNVYAAVQGYNNTPAWDRLEVGVLDTTTGFVMQASASQAIFNNYQVRPSVVFTQYYPAGTRLLSAARAAGGSGLINGNATEFSVFLTGR
jgi:hypothetical protein